MPGRSAVGGKAHRQAGGRNRKHSRILARWREDGETGMIIVQLNRQTFEYDVHSLVKAFYPAEDVKICYEAPEEGTEWSLRLVISFLAGTEEAQETGAAELSAAQARLSVELYDGADARVRSELIPSHWQEDRKETKNELKRVIYRMLSSYTGQTLPWGNLTGIRPTKIAMSLLEQGWRNADIANYMRETYYTSNEKTALAIAIANRERHLLKDINYENGYSLYVGIPFCPSICLYCSFSSSPLSLWKTQVDSYLDALCKEIDYVSDAFAGKELNTVYIGGGTPTTLEPPQLERLLSKLEERFDYGKLLEFTVEAGRPDSITREKLAVLRAHGITRISINPQTMNQRTLDLIGRRHTVEQTVEAFFLAREMGFDNINMDLIVGLPGEEQPEVEHTLQELAKLDPDSITVHSLAVKRASRLRMFRDEYKEMTFTNNRAIMDMAAEYAMRAGQSPYYLYRQKNMAGNFENVGYSKEGKAGIYNILIMEEVQSILALGAGASTKLVLPGGRIERIENVKDIRNYIDRIDEMIERKRSGIHE